MVYAARAGCDAPMKRRPGRTTHLSISLPTEEPKILRGRAKRITAATFRIS